MTVEMAPGKPFVWPEEPDDLAPWGNNLQATKEAEKEQERRRTEPKEEDEAKVRKERGERERGSMSGRARALLEGRKEWRPSWEEHGGQALVAMGREGRGGG